MGQSTGCGAFLVRGRGLMVSLTHNSTHVANEAEEAALRGVCATLADERNIIQGAAALRAPLFSRVRRAGFIVGPVLHWAHVAVHHGHGIHSPYAGDGEG